MISLFSPLFCLFRESVSLCLVCVLRLLLFAFLDDFVSSRLAFDCVQLPGTCARIALAAAHFLPLFKRLLLARFFVVVVARIGIALAGTAVAEIVRFMEDAALCRNSLHR